MAAVNETVTIDIKTRLEDNALKTLIANLKTAENAVSDMTRDLREQLQVGKANGASMKEFAQILGSAGKSAKGLSSDLNESQRSIAQWSSSMDRLEAEMTTLPQKIDIVTKKLDTLAAEGQQGSTAFQVYTRELQNLQSVAQKLAGTNLGNLTSQAQAGQKSMEGWAASMSQLEAEMSTLPQKISIVQQRIRDLASAGQEGTAAWKAYQSELVRLQDFSAKMDAANKGSADSYRNLRFVVQNTSFQLADMAVQFQAGARASTIFAQQLPQILGMFGAFGAIAGVVVAVAASLAGPFIDSLFKTADASKVFDKAMQDVDKAIGDIQKTAREFNLDNVRKQFNEASASARNFIKTDLEFKGSTLARGIEEAQKSIVGLVKEQQKFTALEWFSAAQFGKGDLDPIAKMASNLGVTVKQALELNATLKNISKDSSLAAGSWERIQKLLSQSTKKEAFTFLTDLHKAVPGIAEAEEGLAKLAKTLDDMDKAGAKGMVTVEDGVKKVNGKLTEQQELLKLLNAEYDKIVKANQTPAQGLADTNKQLDLMVKTLGTRIDMGAIEAARKSAEQLFNQQTIKNATEGLTPFATGIKEVADAMDKAEKEAGVLSGKLFQLEVLRGNPEMVQQYLALAASLGPAAPVIDQVADAFAKSQKEATVLQEKLALLEKFKADPAMAAQWEALAKSLGKAAPASAQIAIAVKEMRDGSSGIDAMNKAIAEAAKLYKLTNEEVARLQEKFAKPADMPWLDAINTAVGNFVSSTIKQLSSALLDNQGDWDKWAANLLKSMADVLIQAAILQGIIAALNAYSAGLGDTFSKMLGASSKFAKGGALAGATGLPQGVYNKPTYFPMPIAGVHPFAHGGFPGVGMLAEAGRSEAIVPLMRHGGDLGVASSPINIVVNNNRENTVVDVAQNQEADGSQTVTLTVRREMKAAFSDGSMDSTMRGNYGVNRRAVA